MLVTEATFESVLRHVKECYSILDLANGAPQGQRGRIQVAITFDDGWEDNASTAFPIAAGLKVPFTIFICPELMQKPMPFWPERVVALIRFADTSTDVVKWLSQALATAGYPEWAAALANENGNRADILINRLKSLSFEERGRLLASLFSCDAPSEDHATGNVDRTMSWSQLEQLYSAGVSFGSHTLRHEILTSIPLPRVEEEVRGSKAALEDHIAHCSLFSYPNGDVSREVREIVERFGFKLAFINSPGVWRRSDDPFLIPRINLSEGTLVGSDGQFSRLAFEYRVFWNAFVHRGLAVD
jgi:peptidoglycan/xylan/chitin deacetylase (PgdA/CDA1 family)